MKHAPHRRASAALVAFTMGSLLCGLAAAQGVYRIVGPDGKVTFSDQPPPAAQARPVAGASGASGGTAPAGGNAALPFELRRVAGQFPVTLYTGKDCSPCNSGRNLLNSRGIPYVERTVTTPEDAAALTRLTGEPTVPVLTIGAQQIKGYSDVQWGQYLDAAGYPKQSQLPSIYRRPQPEPLVAVQSALQPAAPNGAAQASPPSASQGPAASSRPAEIPVQPPSGIRF
ncbi:glutaredoxin domain-containing protein [Hydrogenophaga sp. R2]|uniref:glutaredoxin domain-containing protein n=1 Tax=Hydrogenophaga sp. R2 TaxID=3132827 RepID=UPI003CFA1CED